LEPKIVFTVGNHRKPKVVCHYRIFQRIRRDSFHASELLGVDGWQLLNIQNRQS
jgi:hypothetical protein